jgi:hypothetical protein
MERADDSEEQAPLLSFIQFLHLPLSSCIILGKFQGLFAHHIFTYKVKGITFQLSFAALSKIEKLCSL